jgi:putative transposase
MPRKLRIFHPGVPVHMTARGVDDQPIFLSDLDRYELLGILRKTTERVHWRVIAWCLMTTHYHLLVIAAEEPRVSWAMQTINSVYARQLNSRHGRRGHVFGERFADKLVESHQQLQRTIAYILENPVRAGMVRKIEDWPWSGLQTLRPRDEIETVPARLRDFPVRRAG